MPGFNKNRKRSFDCREGGLGFLKTRVNPSNLYYPCSINGSAQVLETLILACARKALFRPTQFLAFTDFSSLMHYNQIDSCSKALS